MKQQLIIIFSLFLFLLTGCNDTVLFSTSSMELKIDNKGFVTSLWDKENRKEYLSSHTSSPLIQIRIDGAYYLPVGCDFLKEDNLLQIRYDRGKTDVRVEVFNKNDYLTFEVLSVNSEEEVELIVWGPYQTTISEIVGECVGVSRNGEFAIGIQALNPKTIGGYPTTEDDVDPSFDIFASTSLVDVSDSLTVLYRGQTARHTEYGSLLQAYCRNRDKERVIPMWNLSAFAAPAYDDGGVIGSKIALFGSAEGQALDYLEAIELGEGLPHPLIEGEWGKKAKAATRAYIIYPFNEQNIEEAIAFTQRTGLKYLYHAGPFRTWGHFELHPAAFPSGYEGLKQCVEKAEAQGIRLGVHTLSNFTTTNDKYVTPVPDQRLAQVGRSLLTESVTADQTTIPVKDPLYFNQMENNSLYTVRIGEELIRYRGVSDAAPWFLLDCERGAWGTVASVHDKGEEIAKLLDHPYKVFLTDIDLTKEEARNLATLFNETGVRQISFDGLEGAWSTGLGQYGLSLMMKEWYDHLLPEYRDNINDASMTTHYNWHIFTRMNWGEPWYAGFRESQMNYRLMNQDFYRRNLIPCMLGWFKFDPDTSLEDIEWLLARSAAFDAGYTLVTNARNVERNGRSDRIVEAIRIWENARLSKAFPKELKKEMEHIENEYSLKEITTTSWELTPYLVKRYQHINMVRQPGEPVVSRWEIENPNQEQPVGFILKTNGKLKGVSLEIGSFGTVEIPFELVPGQYLVYEGTDTCYLYDQNWNVLDRFTVDASRMRMRSGKNTINISCHFENEGNQQEFLSGEIRLKGKPVSLTAAR